jgi:hypothetical protein
MNYTLMRNGQQYGPYTLADLQRHVASGNILVTDLVKSEGMEDWVPVSQVIGNIPVPVTPSPQRPVASADPYPPPPGLHWGIVLGLHIVTCGLFGLAWIIVQAVWVRRVQPNSKGILFVITAMALFFLYGVFSANRETKDIAVVVQIVAVIVWLIGVFSMKASIEEHFSTAEPIGLQLSGVMTFFFNFIYFQYHFTEIAQLKKRQQLSLGQQA